MLDKPTCRWITWCCLLAAALTPTHGVSQSAKTFSVGDAPPPLDVRLLNGQKLDWTALKGNVVVLEFWATWCGPCIGAIPHMNDLTEKNKAKPIRFFAFSNEEESKVKRFLAKKPIKAPVGLASKQMWDEGFNLQSIPETWIIGRDGRIAAITHPNSVTQDVLDQVLAGKPIQLSNKRAPAPAKDAAPTGGPQMGIGGTKQFAPDPANVLQLTLRKVEAQGGIQFGRTNGEFGASSLDVKSLIAFVFGVTQSRIIFDAPVPEGRYELLGRLPAGLGDAGRKSVLKQLVPAALGLTAAEEERESDVYVLTCPEGPKGDLKVWELSGGGHASTGPGSSSGTNQPFKALVSYLESALGAGVVDETGLAARYEWMLLFDEGDEKSLATSLGEMGLVLKRERRKLPVVVVKGAPKA